MDTVRMAIIGTGVMGRKYAEMIDAGQVPGMELAAVVCRSREAKDWAARALSERVVVFDSAEALYGRGELCDGVLIVTPHRSHEELAEKAFKLGKHVLCDKPAGVSVCEARRMSRGAMEAGVTYAVMFHQRLYPKYARIKELLDQGVLGDIRRVMMVNTRYYRTALYHRSGSWRSSWTGEGGGALINQGQHLLDVWQWLFGLPKSVYARIPFGKYNDFAVDDEATLFMEYPDKMTAVFMLSTGEADWQERLEIVGTKGRIELNGDVLRLQRFDRDVREYAVEAATTSREGIAVNGTVEEFPEVAAEPYREMLVNFADSVRTGAPLIVPGQEAEGALELSNAAYLSAWTGQPAALPVDGERFEALLMERAAAEQR